MSRYPLSSALALLIALTILLTWPQVLHLGTQVAAHDDPLFSIWRLASSIVISLARKVAIASPIRKALTMTKLNFVRSPTASPLVSMLSARC